MVARLVGFVFPYIFMPRGCSNFVDLMSFLGFSHQEFLGGGGYVSQRILGATLNHTKK